MAYITKKLEFMACGWPSCFQAVGALTLLLEEAFKLTLGVLIQAYASL